MKISINKKIIQNIIITFLYAIFTLFIVINHETWADEAQVWQLCRHLNILHLFQHLINEGHPAFLYLLFMPFAKLGLSAFTMQLVCWGSMISAVFLLWQFSPFNNWTKTAITISSGFLYFLPVIARSYSLLPLLVFGLAILYPKSKERPFLYIILLSITSCTHIIMLGFTFILGCIFIYKNIIKNFKTQTNSEKTKYISASLIFILSIAYIFLQLSGTTSSNAFITFKPELIFVHFIKVFGLFFINSYDFMFPDTHRFLIPIIDLPIIIASTLIYIYLLISLFFNNKKIFLITFLGILFQIAIYITSYSEYVFVNRIFCAHIILIFGFWILLKNNNFKDQIKMFNKKTINILLTIFFIATFFNGIKASLLEVKYNYSGAKETSSFILQKTKENSIFLIDNEPYCVSLMYYLDDKRKLYSAARNHNIEYVTWDETLKQFMSFNGWEAFAKDAKNYYKTDVYVIIPNYNIQFYKNEKNMEKAKPNSFKQIFQSQPAILKEEGYRLYKYIGE